MAALSQVSGLSSYLGAFCSGPAHGIPLPVSDILQATGDKSANGNRDFFAKLANNLPAADLADVYAALSTDNGFASLSALGEFGKTVDALSPQSVHQSYQVALAGPLDIENGTAALQSSFHVFADDRFKGRGGGFGGGGASGSWDTDKTTTQSNPPITDVYKDANIDLAIPPIIITGYPKTAKPGGIYGKFETSLIMEIPNL